MIFVAVLNDASHWHQLELHLVSFWAKCSTANATRCVVHSCDVLWKKFSYIITVRRVLLFVYTTTRLNCARGRADSYIVVLWSGASYKAGGDAMMTGGDRRHFQMSTSRDVSYSNEIQRRAHNGGAVRAPARPSAFSPPFPGPGRSEGPAFSSWERLKRCSLSNDPTWAARRGTRLLISLVGPLWLAAASYLDGGVILTLRGFRSTAGVTRALNVNVTLR